jgi:hypothetical protein
MSVSNNLFIIRFSNNLDIHRVFSYIGLYGGGNAIYGAETRLTDTVGALVCWAPASTRCQRARHAAWGGSPVGGHGDVFSGGSPWTVTGPLLDLSCSLVMLKLELYPALCSSFFHALCLVLITLHRLTSLRSLPHITSLACNISYPYRRRQITRKGLTDMLNTAQLLSG